MTQPKRTEGTPTGGTAAGWGSASNGASTGDAANSNGRDDLVPGENTSGAR